MPINYTSAGYQISPQFANLGALQGLQPLDVTRKAQVEYRPLTQMQVYSSQPELATQGIAQGIQAAVGGISDAITAQYKEKAEIAKEEKKFQQQIALEKAKQGTENLSFINQERVKLAATKGLEADYEQQDAALVAAGKRVMGVVPEGYKAKETQKTKTDTPPNKVDFSGPLPEITPAPVPSVAVTPTVVADSAPITIPEPLSTQANVVQTAPQAPVVAQAPVTPPVVIKPAQPAGQPTQELTNIQPVTPQGGVVPPPVEFNRPEQPKDPKLPRDLRSYVYMPDESSNAYQAAAELTTPYRKVSVEQNPRTKKLILIQEDTSKDVLDLQVKAQQMGISAEELALKKNQLALDREKQDLVSIESNRKILKEDKSYRESIKNSINKQSTKLELIDDAITKINQNPELVGIYSQYLRGKEPLGGFNYQNIAAILKGVGIDAPMEKIQKIVDIEVSLNSISSNIGWEQLAEMKKLSPTGSAGTGGLTEGERASLERTQGSLDIIKSDSEFRKTLYNLRNGAVKAISNASNEVQSIDPTFKREFYEPLTMNPDEEKRISYLYENLEKATEAQKTQRNYLDGLYELKRLAKKKKEIDDFNKEIGTLVKPK